MRKKDLFITDSKLESFEDFFDEEKVEVTSWSFEEGKEEIDELVEKLNNELKDAAQ